MRLFANACLIHACQANTWLRMLLEQAGMGCQIRLLRVRLQGCGATSLRVAIACNLPLSLPRVCYHPLCVRAVGWLQMAACPPTACWRRTCRRCRCPTCWRWTWRASACGAPARSPLCCAACAWRRTSRSSCCCARTCTDGWILAASQQGAGCDLSLACTLHKPLVEPLPSLPAVTTLALGPEKYSSRP